MSFMIIILIQKYNVTTQGIYLSKMPLFYEVKNHWIYTCNFKMKNKQQQKQIEYLYAWNPLTKCKAHTEDCYKTMLYVLIYDSSKPYYSCLFQEIWNL